MARSPSRIDAFDLEPGRVLAGKYVVVAKLGGGWEGEVYKVAERRTGVLRAAKLFFPQRNVGDKAVRIYAKKLEDLRGCPIVIQYHNTETVRFRGAAVTCLLSEFVSGEIFHNFVQRQPAHRLPPFEALHLVYPLVRGLEQIHKARHYHGDLHDLNVLVNRRGIFFDVKIVDFFHHGAPSRTHMQNDLIDVIHLLHEAVGGRDGYPASPREIKAICKGLRRDLILKAFPTARSLREHLEEFAWR
jgi:tRNA A-37 threonylcarbamoyl transferase component Bud32